MKSFRYGLLLSFMIMNSSALFGHFFKMQTMQKETQTILLVSDYHYSDDPFNQQLIPVQQEAVLDLARKEHALVIVEDGFMANDQEMINDCSGTLQPLVVPHDELHSTSVQTPLHGIHSRCYYQSIDCLNVEFRFSGMRTTQDFLRLLEHKKQLISHYDDPLPFKQIYAQILERSLSQFKKQCPKTYAFLRKSNQRIHEILFKKSLLDNRVSLMNMAGALTIDHPDYDYQQLKTADIVDNIYLYCGCHILDIEILHAIAQHQNKQMIIVLAGDFHIHHCKQQLEALGYACTNVIGEDISLDGTDFAEPTALTKEMLSYNAKLITDHVYQENTRSVNDSWLLERVRLTLIELCVAITTLTGLE